MSYMQFRQGCRDCQKWWNAAFGIVGTAIIAQPPELCPHCGSANIHHIAHGWDTAPGEPTVKDQDGGSNPAQPS